MRNFSKQFVSSCVILMPLVSALMVPQPTIVFHPRLSSSALNFHNPNMDHLDGYQRNYRARESPISLGNRFRTVPKPYYDSSFQHKPARPLSTPPLGRSTPSSSTAAASSPEYSEYSTQDVYWSDVNGFPQDIVDPQAVPSMDDMRNAAMNNNGPSSPAASRFEDIPFQSNENYANRFNRNAETEFRGPGGRGDFGMNGDFGNRPMDRPYNPDMRRSGERNMGGGGYGYDRQPAPGMEQNDFPSLMNEMMPPGRGPMQSPYDYGQGYGGMGMGGEMMGMGPGMGMPRGEWGFQGMGMGPGGHQGGFQEWGYGGPHGGEFYGGGPQQEWGMPPGGGQPFGEPFGGPGGFW